MDFSSMTSILLFFLLADTALSLQVSSHSPCLSVCVDSNGQNGTASNVLDTFGTDISCIDSEYADTVAGKKFESCVNCLRTSSASDSDGNDQEWYLFNLRYSIDYCLFGSGNTSNSVSSSCSADTTCGPLQEAIEDGNLIPGNGSVYSYCSADDNAFLGAYFSKCTSCLQGTSNQKYLSNFMIALQAGCLQQPAAGTLIGMQGTVFSDTPVVITFPGDAPSPSATSQNATHKSGLSQSGIIGVSVGGAVLLIVALSILFICIRRRRTLNHLRRLSSPLDSRFGAENITSPQNGAYGNPYSNPMVSATTPFDDKPPKPVKETTILGNSRSILAKRKANLKEEKPQLGGWQDVTAHLAAQPPSYSGGTIPTHQAYIPTPVSPVSPTESTLTDNTFEMSKYSSSRSSPRDLPQETSQGLSTRSSPRDTSRERHREAPRAASRNASRDRHGGAPRSASREPHREAPRTNSNNPYRQASKHSSPRDLPKGPSIQVPTMAQPLQQLQPSEIQQLQEKAQETSQLYPPTMHSTARATSRTRDRSRSRSRTRDSWRRNTVRTGIGNVNASKETPIRISGPMIRVDGRFDFEIAERERMEREAREQAENGATEKKEKTDSPQSANSEEQWPGTY